MIFIKVCYDNYAEDIEAKKKINVIKISRKNKTNEAAISQTKDVHEQKLHFMTQTMKTTPVENTN